MTHFNNNRPESGMQHFAKLVLCLHNGVLSAGDEFVIVQHCLYGLHMRPTQIWQNRRVSF